MAKLLSSLEFELELIRSYNFFKLLKPMIGCLLWLKYMPMVFFFLAKDCCIDNVVVGLIMENILFFSNLSIHIYL